MWVHVSSIVNEVIKTISIFLRKILNAQKRKSNQNQLTKQKQVNEKQQRQRFFCAKNLLRWGKLFILHFLKK